MVWLLKNQNVKLHGTNFIPYKRFQTMMLKWLHKGRKMHYFFLLFFLLII